MSTHLPEELSRLEAELAALRPSEPSEACGAKLEMRIRSLDTGLRPAARPDQRREGPSVSWFNEWRPLAQAAAIVLTAACLTFWIEGRGPATAAQGPAVARTDPQPGPEDALTILSQPNPALRLLRPVSATQVVLSAEPEGMVEMPDGTLARRIRARSMQHIRFSEEGSRPTVTYSVPREDIVLVPVNAY